MALFGSLQFHSTLTRTLKAGCLAFVLSLLLAVPGSAQAPSWIWEISPSSGNDSWIRDMAVDQVDGSIYVVGSYREAGILGLPNPWGNSDAFLAKLTPAGAVVWSVRLGANSDDQAYGVTVAQNGAVALVGGFEGSLQAGTISGASLSLNSTSGSEDVFIACYSPNGILLWLSRAGGPSTDRGTSIVSGDFGFAVQGLFTSSISFQTSGIPITLAPVAAANQTMAFVAKFDQQSGACTKAVLANAAGAMNPERMATDGENIFVTGTHRGNTITWRTTDDTAIGSHNAGATTIANGYVTALNGALDHKWSVHVSNPGDQNIECNGIAVGCGRVYITGSTHAGSDIAGITVPTATTHDHAFVAALTLEDGLGAWVRTAQSSAPHSQLGYDLAVSNDGDILVSGRFTNDLVFDTGETISGTSGSNGYIARYAPTGDLEWVQPVIGDEELDLMAVAVHASDQVLFAGSLDGDCSWNASTASGNNTILLAKVLDIDANSLQLPVWQAPSSICANAAPIDLTMGISGTARGSATAVQSITNVSNANNAIGGPNGSGATFTSTSSRLVLDLGTTLYPGDRIQLVVRSNSSSPFTLDLSGSETTSTSVPIASGVSAFGTRYQARWIRVNSPTRYIWLGNTTNNTGYLDAVRWVKIGHVAGSFSWNASTITQFDPTIAGLGNHSITYTINAGTCALSTARQIEVVPGPTGTITGPSLLCTGGSGTYQLTMANADQFAWQRSNAGAGVWTTFNTTQQTLALSYTIPTDVRVALRNTACPDVVHTNIITISPGDPTPPTLPALPNIVQTTTSASCSTTVSFNAPLAVDNCTFCDPGSVLGYTKLGVFQGHAYYVSNNTSDWVTANTGATASGGHLVSITSSEENAWIASRTLGLTLYTGLNDIAIEGQFVWTTGEPVTYDNWADDQPDNGLILNQDWGTMNFGSPGLWDDEGGLIYTPRRHILEFDCAVWQSAGPIPPATFPIGSTPVSFSATDARGNVSTTTFMVLVTDITPPSITYPNTSITLTKSNWPNCSVALPDLTPQASIVESCAVTRHQRPIAGTLLHNDTTVWILARDASGNMDSVAVSVRLEDQTGPVITNCPNGQSIIVANAGDTSVPYTYSMPIAQDCSPFTASLVAGLLPGEPFPLGTTEVRWRFTDDSGHFSECSFHVIVGANDAPQLTCPTLAAFLTEPGQCSAMVNYTPPIAIDAQDGNITAVLLAPSLPPGPFPIGTTMVTYRVQDLDGNSATCSFSVTVNDGEAPTITCPPSQTLNSATTECSVFASWPPPVVADNCPSCLPSAALSSYVLLGIHDGKQYYISNDPETHDGAIAASQAMGYHLLSIGTAAENDFIHASTNAIDVDPVWIGLTDEITEGSFLWHSGEPLIYENWVGGEPNQDGDEDGVMMTSTGQWNDVPVGISLPYIIEVPCSGLDLYQTGGPTIGSAFSVGTTDVSYTVIDAAGRSADCVFSITVVDSTPPIFSNCPSNETLSLPGNDCTLAYILPTVLSDDGNACDADTENGYRTEVLLSGEVNLLDITGWSNLSLPRGTHLFRETHSDDAGNQAMCEWMVTVQDLMHPEVICLLTDSFPLFLDGACSIAFPDLRSYVTATDCNGVSIDMQPEAGTIFYGDTLVSMTMWISDSLGNGTWNNHSIWIHDNTPPTILCQDTLTVTTTVNCLGNVIIPSPTSISDECGYTSWTVDANDGLWPAGDSTVTYMVTDGRNISTCSMVVRVLDGIPSVPTILLSGPTTFCDGGSVILTSSSAIGNLWSNGATTPSITVSTPDDYSVTVTNSNGCSATSAGTTVTVNPNPAAPTISAGGPLTFCTGGSVTLTSSSATGNVWSTGATTQSITVSTAGTYTVTVTNGNGCSATSAGTTVTVNPNPTAPTISAGGPLTFCAGGSVTLTSSSATGNVWSTGATTQSITVSTAGTYTVTVTNGNGCSATSATVVVASQDMTPPTIICPSNITLIADPGYCGKEVMFSASATDDCVATPTINYSHVPGSVFMIGAPTTVTASASDGVNPPSTCSFTVTVNAPVVDFEYPVTTICQNADPIAPSFVSHPGGTFSDANQVGTIDANGLFDPASANVGPHTLGYVFNTGAGCVHHDWFLINVVAAPIINTGSYPPLCITDPAIALNATPAGGSWAGPGTIGTTFDPAAAGIGTHVITYSSSLGGCTATDSTTITVHPIPATPTITAAGPITFCAGNSVVLTCSTATSYLWSNGATTQSITVSNSGTYSVSVSNGSGCSATSGTTIVTVNPLPLPTITADGPTTFCDGGSVILESSNSSGNTWTTGATTPTITVMTSGSYAVTVTDINGCSATSGLVLVQVNSAPQPVIAPIPVLCSAGGPIELVGTPSTGLWSGPGVIGASFNPQVAGPGNHLVNYTIAQSGCTNSASIAIQVDEQFIAPSFTYTGAPFCTSGSVVSPPEFTATPNPGGTFSNTGLADFNTATGQFNAGGTTDSTYQVIYTSASNGVCPSQTNSTMVQVNSSVWAGNDAGLVICGSAAPSSLFSLLTGANAGGTWTSPLGTPHSGMYDPALDAPGVYRYTVTGLPGCDPDIAQVTVSETTAPDGGTLVGNAEHCGTTNSGTLILSGHSGNMLWQKRINGGPWIDVVNATATYTYSNLAIGTYTYRVLLDAPGCPQAMSNLVTVVVTDPPNAGTANPILICEGTSFTLDVLVINEDMNGTWTDMNGTVVSGTVMPMVTTNYTYSVPGNGTCASDSRTVQVIVNQRPNAGSNGSLTLCSTEAPVNLFNALGGTPAAGGVWTGPSAISGGLYDASTMDPGTYTYTVSGQIPCPSAQSVVVITEVTATANTTTISACDSYTWNVNNQAYTQSGTYTSVSSCGTQTLVLTITPSTNNSTTISACDTYTWSVNGQTYTQSGTYTDVDACHTETLVLTITPSTSNTATISACEPYIWNVNSQSYTQSGTYTHVDGCHTETLVLTITPSTSNTTTISACDTYTWSVNGQTYTQSGTYTDVDDCHTDTLVLTITPNTGSTSAISACGNYTWDTNGVNYDQSGTYFHNVGCVTDTLVLTITPNTGSTTMASACGEYIWTINNATYFASGTYIHTAGCITDTLVLTVTPITVNSTNITACDSYTWNVNGDTYLQSGTYTSTVDCHTETLALTIVTSTNNVSTVTACDQFTWNINNVTYEQSGTYTSMSDCGTQTLVLTITQSTSNITFITTCDSYTWSVNGDTYLQSGTYTSTVDCHTETLVLSIIPSTNNTTAISACGTYTWNISGLTYTESGSYSHTDGCVTENLVLTITPSITNTTTAAACDTYTWSVNGTSYFESGTYFHTVGCVTDTLVLTITPNTGTTSTISACGSYTWNTNGVNYEQSGTYFHTVGCVTDTLVLTITPNAGTTSIISACGNYTWNTNGVNYEQSGTYFHTLGCVTDTLVLAITPNTGTTSTISACGNYTWNTNGINYEQSGTYFHNVGCVTDTLVLTITPTPSAAFAFASPLLCTNAQVVAPVVNSSGGLFTSSEGLMIDPMTGAIDPALSIPGSYTITHTLDGQCPSSANMNVTIVAAPNAEWTSPTTTCDNSGTLPLNDMAMSPGGVWSGPGVTGTAFDPVGLLGPVTITYTVESSGCTASTSHDIAVIGAPQAVAGPDTTICGFELLLSGDASSGTGIWSGPVEVLFMDPNAPKTTAIATGAGNYSLVWTVSENGCSSTDTAIVTMRPPADQLTVFAGEDQILEVETTTTLEATADAGAQLQWALVSGSAQFAAPNANTTVISGLSLGTNTVMVTVSLGSCVGNSDTLTIVVEDLFIPQGFSPNGDGDNDRFEVTGMMAYPNSSFLVFNRWGQTVYEHANYSNEWDGRSAAGIDLPDDTYFYVLNLEGDRTYNGFVVIKR